VSAGTASPAPAARYGLGSGARRGLADATSRASPATTSATISGSRDASRVERSACRPEPKHRVLELAPVNWPETSQREDVQRLLDGDPYRALTLGG
jgi:hypothetical protein